MARRPPLPESHVFPDGMTLQKIRDAIVASSATGMWHLSKEMAHRYGAHKMLCFKCATIEPVEQNVTYYPYRGLSIRICRKCAKNGFSFR